MRTLLTLSLVALASGAARADVGWRWIEAERPVASNMTAKHLATPENAAQAAKLSGGVWIGSSSKRKTPLFAVYDVDVAADATYTLYARKFWLHGPFKVTFDNVQTAEVGPSVALLDAVPLRTNIVANWVNVGRFELKAGKHRFRVESTTNDGAFAIDCFLLTSVPFTARGALKPDEHLASTTPGWFAWDPSPDAPNAALDLSSLNEPEAGSKGPIAAKDGRFVHSATGEPARFWGINVTNEVTALDDAELDQLAAMLARRGVNLVRLHGPPFQPEGGRAGAIDPTRIDNTRRAIAAFKRHGIYSALSIYFPLWIRLDAQYGWPGYKNQNPFGLPYVDAKFQSLYRSWWKALLFDPDPKTGVALAKDPAIFSLEIVNEDSLFFHTFKPYEVIPAEAMEPLERRFAAWLAQRHGTARAAVDAWKAEKVRGDDPDNGRVGLCAIYRMANNRDARSRETVRFLYEVQTDFYARTRDYLRNELGATSMVVASNWMTGSDQYLGPLDRASYFAGDYIDRHGYYNGASEGPKAGYLISDGDRYSDRSALRFDPEKPGEKQSFSNPSFDTSYNDRPSMISEVDWLEPNRYRGEVPWLFAAYGSLQGLDAVTFFTARSGPGWLTTVQKFAVLSPVALGQYPAAALMYRTGMLEEAAPISDARLRLQDLLDLEGGPTGIDARARLVGKVQVTIDDTVATSRPTVDLKPYHDEAARTFRSATGQLTFDYGNGLLRIDAPRAQAVVGFLSKAGDVALGTLTIRSTLEYGAIAVVALDGQPIATSRKLLVQAMSEQTNTGWRTSGESLKTIDSIGVAPMIVRDLEGSIDFRDGGTWSAQPVDASGAASGAPADVAGTLTLRPDVPYYVLSRAAVQP